LSETTEDLEIVNPVFEEEPEPQIELPPQSSAAGEPISPTNFEYNRLNQIAYTKYKFPLPDTVDADERRFLDQVDLSKGQIKRIITKFIRLKATDPVDNKRKEYMYYFETWQAMDMFGNEVDPVTSHIEGMYHEIKVRYPIKNNMRQKEPVPNGGGTVYYIPWNRKTLDRIIKRSFGGDRETMKFVVKVSETQRAEYSYEQFANLPFIELQRIHTLPGGPDAHPYRKEDYDENGNPINSTS